VCVHTHRVSTKIEEKEKSFFLLRKSLRVMIWNIQTFGGFTRDVLLLLKVKVFEQMDLASSSFSRTHTHTQSPTSSRRHSKESRDLFKSFLLPHCACVVYWPAYVYVKERGTIYVRPLGENKVDNTSQSQRLVCVCVFLVASHSSLYIYVIVLNILSRVLLLSWRNCTICSLGSRWWRSFAFPFVVVVVGGGSAL